MDPNKAVNPTKVTVAWSVYTWYEAEIDLSERRYEGLTSQDFLVDPLSERVQEVLNALESPDTDKYRERRTEEVVNLVADPQG